MLRQREGGSGDGRGAQHQLAGVAGCMIREGGEQTLPLVVVLQLLLFDASVMADERAAKEAILVQQQAMTSRP